MFGHLELIVPDTRGINLSDKPESEDDYVIDILIEDIKELANKLNVKEFTLVGHDWGGSLAFGFATLYPELLKGLVTMNCPHPALTSRKIQQSQNPINFF